MISEQVRNLRDDFVLNWNKAVTHVPMLELDNSWPSIGVLDQLLFHLRRRELTHPDKRAIKSAAAYLSCFAHEIWSSFGVDVNVSDGPKGIVIEAVGGSIDKGQSFMVEVEEQLKRILREQPNPFPIIGNFARNISVDEKIVSLFALGLITGLSPFGEGAWLAESTATFKENIDKAVRIVARTSASHYARLYPDEKLGQVAELYLNQLVYPPALMEEGTPVIGATNGILEFSKQYGVSKPQLETLTHNLARGPDNLISDAALVYHAAICEGTPSAEMLAVCEGKGPRMGILRPALIILRQEIEGIPDWIHQGELSPKEEQCLEREAIMGFLPWNKLPKVKIRRKKKEPKLVSLLQAMAQFDLPAAVRVADSIIEETPGDLDVRFQRIYLEMINRNMIGAHESCKSLLSEPGAEKEAMLFALWGLCDLARNEIAEAVRHLAQAHSLMRSTEVVEYYQVANNYAWALILNSKFGEAISILDLIIKNSPCPLTALLNKAYALRAVGEIEKAREIQASLTDLYPLDARVFGNFLLGPQA